ncbi:MAG: hypothetical protein ACRD1N_01065 [Terriglobia bacterium]
MGGPLQKSKRQFDGNPEQSPPDDFVLFLDENLHNCAPLLKFLDSAGVRFERQGAHFRPGTRDAEWLPYVCKRGWILLTKDKGIRYNQLEIVAVLESNGREFFFASGNLTGAKMAEILSAALSKMKRMTRRIEAPFIASLSQRGEVHLRYDRGGSIHDQKKRKAKTEQHK